MGEVGHVLKGKDQCTPKGRLEAQFAISVNWGVPQPSQKPAAGKKIIWCSLPYSPQTRQLESIGIRK
jgi:hypothetical protein